MHKFIASHLPLSSLLCGSDQTSPFPAEEWPVSQRERGQSCSDAEEGGDEVGEAGADRDCELGPMQAEELRPGLQEELPRRPHGQAVHRRRGLL